MFQGIQAIFYFVPDVCIAAKWYSEFLELPIEYFDSNGEIEAALIKVGSVEIFFHPVDEKMSAGNAGQVAYWKVANFHRALELAQNHGAKIYRGPLAIEENQAICQMWDPFGNLFGMQGRLSL